MSYETGWGLIYALMTFVAANMIVAALIYLR